MTRVTAALTEQLEREPTSQELAAELEMEMAELHAFQSMAQPRQVVSLDEKPENSHGEDGLSLSERLADPAMTTPDAALVNAEARCELRACLKKLPKTQATVIVLHYLQGVPLRDVAAMLAVTPSRVSQLHHQALVRLRALLQRLQGVA